MKPLLLFLLLLSSTANAEFIDDPYAKFSTKNNFTNSSKITWKPVDNVQEECNKIQTKLNGKPYQYKVMACSEWKENLFFSDECVIITSKNTTMWTIGHEVRHCFQGAYHK